MFGTGKNLVFDHYDVLCFSVDRVIPRTTKLAMSFFMLWTGTVSEVTVSRGVDLLMCWTADFLWICFDRHSRHI